MTDHEKQTKVEYIADMLIALGYDKAILNGADIMSVIESIGIGGT